MNINDKSALRECTSCQMCGAVCSQDAITIRLNEDGFYRPYIDEEKCVDCGLCTKVCYKFEAEVNVITPEDTEVRSAQSKSDSLLKNVTSGGVADALAKELVKQGYTCIGVTYNVGKHRAEHIVATTSEETDAFRGSKYIQSYSMDAFKTMVKNVRMTKFAVFGLPCHIFAAHKFLTMRKLRENSILIDLFCHGCPSMLVWNKYEKEIQQTTADYDDIQFRSKAHGWGAFHVAASKNGKRSFVSSPKNDEFYSLFFCDQVLNDGCADCQLRSTLAYPDIRLGDFWGKRYLSDTKGVSAVAITSERGAQLFDAVKSQFITDTSNMKEVVVKQSYGRTYNPNKEVRKMMLDSLHDENSSLKDTYSIFYSRQGIAFKVKTMIKHVSFYLPFDLARMLKRFF